MLKLIEDVTLASPGISSREPDAVRPLLALLHQLFDLVATMTDEDFSRKPVGVIESSIGSHIRHNLDHVRALIRGLVDGEVCYDHRDRDTNIERDRVTAMAAILQLERELAAFPWADVPRSLKLSALVASDLLPVETRTTPERELAFVVSHTIHHNAIIAVMAKLLGVTVPAEFGYAPSTIAHKRSRACVR